MGNVLSEEKKQQVIALGRLGWSLRRIETATEVRRETASGYLSSGSSVAPAPAASEVCTAALPADRSVLERRQRMLELPSTTMPTPSASVIPLTRYLRPASQYALLLRPAAPSAEGGGSE